MGTTRVPIFKPKIMSNYPKLMMVKYSQEMKEEAIMLVIAEDNGGYICRVECNSVILYKWYACARELTESERAGLLQNSVNTLSNTIYNFVKSIKIVDKLKN